MYLGVQHNPTGFMPTPAVWQDIVDVVSERGAHLFCDEMYRGFELNGNTKLSSGEAT
jgi:aspartate/methionine/tyrosine aminotransferase